MDSNGSPTPSNVSNKLCRTNSPQGSIIKYPTFSSLTEKNFRNAVDFNTQTKWPCKNTWYNDVNSLHIRNKAILDLPYPRPKCCSEIHDIVVDRKKVKKLEHYGLTRPVRKRTSNLEPEKVERCIPADSGEKSKITRFPECYTLAECSSEEELGKDDAPCSEAGNSKDLGSSSSKDGAGKKKGKEVKKDWKELLNFRDVQFCETAVAEEVKKHKMGQDIKLNLRKV